MKWIVSVHEKNGHLEEFRVLGWSLDRPDIEFQFDKKIIVNAIKNGAEYKTAYLQFGKFVEGSEVTVIENRDGSCELRTKKNDMIIDNLGEMKRF